jgi:hypothetical protein
MNKDLLELLAWHFEEYVEEQERRLNYACRHLIPHRIRGVITKGKIKYRGLYLERKGDSVFPILCGKESRSGKRKSFRIDLNFEGYDLLQYECITGFESNLTHVFMFGNYSKGDRWEVGGIANQITTNNE